jgi:hypothetical protein
MHDAGDTSQRSSSWLFAVPHKTRSFSGRFNSTELEIKDYRKKVGTPKIKWSKLVTRFRRDACQWGCGLQCSNYLYSGPRLVGTV